jgi:two-component system, response regulator
MAWAGGFSGAGGLGLRATEQVRCRCGVYLFRSIALLFQDRRVEVLEDGQRRSKVCSGRPYARRNLANGPRVVLLDLMLPKVYGLEVLKRIKSAERTKMIPVMVMTSSKKDRDMVESVKLGMNSTIPKPVEFEKFGVAVRQFGLYWLLVNTMPR